jgi:hypothetical protein
MPRHLPPTTSHNRPGDRPAPPAPVATTTWWPERPALTAIRVVEGFQHTVFETRNDGQQRKDLVLIADGYGVTRDQLKLTLVPPVLS